ncbi:MAG: DinB family protein, partial [Armatimonadetes bacterium]|nr:DinB family protein [Armatimonadota bacterium]
MLWRDLLTSSIHYTYACTDKLLALVDDSQLDWKPA